MSQPRLTIIIDTREQRELHFSDDVDIVRRCLPCGDYSIVGREGQVAIERKNLSDLLGTITSGRERFERELVKLADYKFKALIIEATWPQIEMGMWPCPSTVHPNSVFGSIIAFAVKYNVMPIMAKDHDTAGRVTERFLRLADKYLAREEARAAAGDGRKSKLEDKKE